MGRFIRAAFGTGTDPAYAPKVAISSLSDDERMVAAWSRRMRSRTSRSATAMASRPRGAAKAGETARLAAINAMDLSMLQKESEDVTRRANSERGDGWVQRAHGRGTEPHIRSGANVAPCCERTHATQPEIISDSVLTSNALPQEET